MFRANIVPGQGFVPISVYSEQSQVTATGRAVGGQIVDTGKNFYGIITNASEQEIDQWKQKGHPITHKVTQYGASPKAETTNYLRTSSAEYYVQGTKNPAGLDVTMIYYVEQRRDIKKEVAQPNVAGI